ncbi:kinase-like domain-containing protein [Colletotrichum godetiae]|uniref:Kinase-like domain-containing protein n=1 Tax=Colletotrichum godetiae TaxID=1209918 RepID=A0AAJ0EKN2_9PEZI|nr:kinase-like domain-containing protein [Colletotrichum godetiae]KAK1656640.1 kinase-like domain-containing protein [Colletotrichum godetiae]
MELLRIVKARQDGSSGAATILIKAASPWAAYEKMYRQLLGDDDIVLVAEKRGISGDVVDIRHFPELSAQQTKMLQSIQHPNIVTVHEIYSNKANHHVVYEHMPRSLQEAVGNPYLNRQRLAAIIGQVVEALVHLEKMGLQHDRLSCSCVLLHPSGRVKLSGQEDCRPLSRRKDLVDLGYTMMELCKDIFLSATTTASSAAELSEVSLT